MANPATIDFSPDTGYIDSTAGPFSTMDSSEVIAECFLFQLIMKFLPWWVLDNNIKGFKLHYMLYIIIIKMCKDYI